MANGEKVETKPEKEVPDAVKDFELLLQDYGIKKAAIIANNIGVTGGPNIFDRPDDMAKGLAKWPREIAPVYRQSILEHWFKSRGITVTEGLVEEVGMTNAERKEQAKKKELQKKLAEGAVWKVDLEESGMPKIRMIKDESEPGITLSEAKTAAKEIGKEREEPIVIYEEAQGKHLPNFKSSFVRQNLTAAWAIAKQMDKAMAEGEAADPMDIWIDQQAKLTQLKEAFGVSPEAKEKGTIGELVGALKDLQEMAKEGKEVELPSWMTDPAKFIETVKTVTATGEAGAKPEWMTDPVKFIETVKSITAASGEGTKPQWLSDPAQFIKTIREITGEEGKGDEAVKAELGELRKTLETMQEERHKQELSSLQTQITEQAKTHEKHMQAVLEKMEDLKKSPTGKTEMDILYEVASEGVGVAKTELAGMRGMIKEAFTSSQLPSPKTPQEREERKKRYGEAIQKDEGIEQSGRKLFFGEG